MLDIIQIMDFEERTKDIYEQISAYPKPPLVPLPDLDDVDTFQDMGVKITPRSRRVLRQAAKLSGLRSFQEKLANQTEEILRRTNVRGPGLYAPVISASLALTDDPRNLDPYQRAATLLAGARSLHQDIFSARLEPDRFRDQVLEMGQYPNLFATNIIIDKGVPRLYKSTNSEYITVIVNGHYYWLRAWHAGEETNIERLAAALRTIASTQTDFEPGQPYRSPGLLTTADDRTQIRIFNALSKDAENNHSLETIRHSFIVLCLDLENCPSDDAQVALESQVGNNANRWFHSSFQLIIFGNAKAAALCSFSAYLDGNVMMRGIAEVHRRALSVQLDAVNPHPQGEDLTSIKLHWNVNAKMLQAAEKSFSAVSDHQQATFTISEFGREMCSRQDVDAVPAFILALQITANQLTGLAPRITQFASMSRYRCMDLATAVVTTTETLNFVENTQQPDADLSELRRQMKQAIQSQVQAVRTARAKLSLPSMLYYFKKGRSNAQQIRSQMVFSLALQYLRMVGEYTPLPREIVVSHPEIYAAIPVVGRPGVRLPYAKYFGLHYQIFPDRTVITMMPGVTWKVANTDLIQNLTDNLKLIARIISTPEV